MTDKTVKQYILAQTKDPMKYPYSFLKRSSETSGQRTLFEF